MSIIAAGTSSGTALVSTGDTNGTLVIQTNGTTVAATFGTNQSLTVVGATTLSSTLGVTGVATLGNGAILNTPASMTGTNITGTAAAFNINGTVGATTPAAGAFTTITASSSITASGTFISGNPTPMTAASVGSNPGTAAIWDGSGNLYKQSSSMRYKENIVDWTVTDAQLDAFVNLSPKLWDYTGKQNGCAGFIAEDIEALGLKNAYNTSPLINYSNEGQPDSNRDFALIALQHKVIQRLEKSLQEQQALITALTAAIQELKAEFDAYKAAHP